MSHRNTHKFQSLADRRSPSNTRTPIKNTRFITKRDNDPANCSSPILSSSPWRDQVRMKFAERIKNAREETIRKRRNLSNSHNKEHDHLQDNLIKNEANTQIDNVFENDVTRSESDIKNIFDVEFKKFIKEEDDWISQLSPEELYELENQLYYETKYQKMKLEDGDVMAEDLIPMQEDLYLNELIQEQLVGDGLSSFSDVHQRNDIACFVCQKGILWNSDTESIACNSCPFFIQSPSSHSSRMPSQNGFHFSSDNKNITMFTPEKLLYELKTQTKSHELHCMGQLMPLFTKETGLILVCSNCEVTVGF